MAPPRPDRAAGPAAPRRRRRRGAVVAAPRRRAVAWSPVGDRLAVSFVRGGVALYDVSDPPAKPDPTPLEKPAHAVTSLSWSGDGKYLLGGDSTPGAGVAYVWDTDKRKIVNRLK